MEIANLLLQREGLTEYVRMRLGAPCCDHCRVVANWGTGEGGSAVAVEAHSSWTSARISATRWRRRGTSWVAVTQRISHFTLK